jgi:predicted lipoprotein with Yx(FWY)xxD motif
MSVRVRANGTRFALAALLALSAVQLSAAERYRPPVRELEQYRHVPMPPGFAVQYTDVDGPVFVDSHGLTLYSWPLQTLRNGDAGDQRGTASCEDVKYTTNAGLMSPYPAGLILPDIDNRPSCVQVWPPVYADEHAKPVGKFTILHRSDGRLQWAYDGYALYTSVLDKRPGEVNGGSSLSRKFDQPVLRVPVGPPSAVPPAFAVKTNATGRIVVTASGYSVYTWDGDAPNRSTCDSQCLRNEWVPISAGQSAVSQGEWSVIERSPGMKQWAFRSKPLYTHAVDHRLRSLEGSDVPGWHNVYAQPNPEPPAEFSVHTSRSGQVLADKSGRTLYRYNCDEDSLDQLACDHPTTTQAYRLAICGNGDPIRCYQTWPYALAPANAKSSTLIWGTAWIDSHTGRFTRPNVPGALHVWTFRDRPLYTFAGDEKPGDMEGDAWGEVWGLRNGFKAFWLRDDFTQIGAGGNAD